jgi:hypothetical protein
VLYNIKDEVGDEDPNTFEKSIQAAQNQETNLVAQMKKSIIEGTLSVSDVRKIIFNM